MQCLSSYVVSKFVCLSPWRKCLDDASVVIISNHRWEHCEWRHKLKDKANMRARHQSEEYFKCIETYVRVLLVK